MESSYSSLSFFVNGKMRMLYRSLTFGNTILNKNNLKFHKMSFLTNLTNFWSLVNCLLLHFLSQCMYSFIYLETNYNFFLDLFFSAKQRGKQSGVFFSLLLKSCHSCGKKSNWNNILPAAGHLLSLLFSDLV